MQRVFPRYFEILGLILLFAVVGFVSAAADEAQFEGEVTSLEGSVLLRLQPDVQFEREFVRITTDVAMSPEPTITSSVGSSEIISSATDLIWRFENPIKPDESIFIRTTDRGEVLAISVPPPPEVADPNLDPGAKQFAYRSIGFYPLPPHPIEQGDNLWEFADFAGFRDGIGIAEGYVQNATFDLKSIVIGTTVFNSRDSLVSETSGSFVATFHDYTLTGTIYGYTVTDIATALAVEEHLIVDIDYASPGKAGNVRNETISSRTIR